MIMFVGLRLVEELVLVLLQIVLMLVLMTIEVLRTVMMVLVFGSGGIACILDAICSGNSNAL